MKLLLRVFLLLLVSAPFALAALAWFALAEQPTLNTEHKLSHQDIARAKTIIKRHDPRHAGAGTIQTLAIGQQDLDLAANYMLQRAVRGSARVAIGEQTLNLAASAYLPILPWRPYLNVLLQLEQEESAARISRLQIGDVPVPPLLAGWLLQQLSARLPGSDEAALARSIVQRVEFSNGMLRLGYRWQPDALRALGTQLAGSDADVLAAHQEHLLALQKQEIGLRGSMIPTLQAMFRFARHRSEQGDAIAENRAALLVLGAWASERGTRALVPRAATEPRTFGLTLQQRRDFAQHFLVSAALAAGGDTTLADAVGLFKEVSDSRGGTGFSFADLAADRAGTRFGELATASPEAAKRLQQQLGQSLSEGDVMPPAREMPESLTEAEFARRYRKIGSPEYEAIVAEIERRLDACRLYRN